MAIRPLTRTPPCHKEGSGPLHLPSAVPKQRHRARSPKYQPSWTRYAEHVQTQVRSPSGRRCSQTPSTRIGVWWHSHRIVERRSGDTSWADGRRRRAPKRRWSRQGVVAMTPSRASNRERRRLETVGEATSCRRSRIPSPGDSSVDRRAIWHSPEHPSPGSTPSTASPELDRLRSVVGCDQRRRAGSTGHRSASHRNGHRTATAIGRMWICMNDVSQIGTGARLVGRDHSRMQLSHEPRLPRRREADLVRVRRREWFIGGLVASLGVTALILAATAREELPPGCWVPLHPHLTAASRIAAGATVLPVALAFAWRARLGVKIAVIAACIGTILLNVLLDQVDCRDLGP